MVEASPETFSKPGFPRKALKHEFQLILSDSLLTVIEVDIITVCGTNLGSTSIKVRKNINVYDYYLDTNKFKWRLELECHTVFAGQGVWQS